jgi:hypothetical protein
MHRHRSSHLRASKMPDRELVCCGLELDCWDEVKDGLQKALDVDSNKYTLDYLKRAIEQKRMQLWCIHDGTLRAAFITRITDYPNARILECMALTGRDPAMWIGFLLESMHKFAKENECDLMETGGRKGWERLFKKHGWDDFHIRMSRRV